MLEGKIALWGRVWMPCSRRQTLARRWENVEGCSGI